jgi:arginine kinase
LATPKV